jgi:serine protease AprX
MMLPSAPLPATSSFSSKVGEAESISAAAYPNPAADRTTLSYTLKNDEAAVSISLFDAYGQFISTLEVGNTKAAGTYSLDVGTQTLQSGVYEARIVSQSGTKTVKVIVVR